MTDEQIALAAAADAVCRSADIWQGFSMQDAKVCVDAYMGSRATPADHSRDSVIEECARICETLYYQTSRESLLSAAGRIREQDAAIESQQRESTPPDHLEASAAICQRRAAEALSNTAIHADGRTVAHAALICAAAEILGLKSSGNGESS